MQVFSLTYEYKLKPTSVQIARFKDGLEQCRRVYNYALAERKDWFESRSCQINACSLQSEYIITAETKRPNYASQCKTLTTYRKTSGNRSASAISNSTTDASSLRTSIRQYVGARTWFPSIQEESNHALFRFSSSWDRCRKR
jgi:transposase